MIGDPPFLDIKVSLYNLPCYNHALKPAPSSSADYYLLHNPAQGCDELAVEEYSKELDSYPAEDLFTDNNFKSETFNLPEYSDFLQNQQARLFERKRLSVKPIDGCNVPDPTVLDKYQDISITYAVIMSSLSLGFQAAPLVLAIAVLVVTYCIKNDRCMSICLFSTALLDILTWLFLIANVIGTSVAYFPHISKESNMNKAMEGGCYLESKIADFALQVEEIHDNL